MNGSASGSIANIGFDSIPDEALLGPAVETGVGFLAGFASMLGRTGDALRPWRALGGLLDVSLLDSASDAVRFVATFGKFCSL